MVGGSNQGDLNDVNASVPTMPMASATSAASGASDDIDALRPGSSPGSFISWVIHQYVEMRERIRLGEREQEDDDEG